MTVVKNAKAEKHNKVLIDIVIKPNIKSLKGIDFSLAITPTFPYEKKTAVFNPDTGMISF